ncbi:hypothetical protein GGE65_001280 [Skermanella aerolata]|uniref:hypothetical protein n=1 Tax=Skermanella aerolata TaxID=393310 RepID=UPI003D2527BD
MPNSPIKPPSNLSPTPDKETAKGISDYTGQSADNRVLYVDLKFFKYGTRDNVHATALILSLFLFVLVVAIIIAGFFTEATAWVDKVFNWATGAFLFVLGIALGKGGGSKDNINPPD